MESMPMRNPFNFFTELMRQPFWTVAWVYYLVLLNLSSAFFWNEPLAQVIFFTFIISACSIIGLYSRFGFEKIMGMGHVFWLPLLVFLVPQIIDSRGGYCYYLIVLFFSIIVSLAFDIVDVWKYLAREESQNHQPQPVEKVA